MEKREKWQERYLKYIIEVVLKLKTFDALSINTEMNHLEVALEIAQEASEITLKEVHVVPLEGGRVSEAIKVKPLLSPIDTNHPARPVMLRIDDTAGRHWEVEEEASVVAKSAPLLQAVGNLAPPQLNKEVAPWAVIPYPSEGWAAYLNLDEDQLWNLFGKLFALEEERFDQERQALVQRYLGHLNRLEGESYHFEGGGSNFKVAINPNSRWRSGLYHLEDGRTFIAHLPLGPLTMLTACHTISGTITASIPFKLLGGVVEGATFNFFEGELTSYTAERGEELLSLAFEIDEGARRVSEISLIDKRLALPPLTTEWGYKGFDQGVSNSFTFGMGEASHIEALGEYSDEEELARATGCNLSAIRVRVPFSLEGLSVSCEGEGVVMRDGEFIF
ncbi:MAG: aminopeptidase [Sphaerochaetaceae bacterium]|jgi:leucyl aminopeptidase (aminopeptidase T)